MLNSIINAFTKGDIKGLDAKLLHSAYWSQHNAKLYGSEKLNTIVGNFLSLVGKVTIIPRQSIRQDNYYVIHLVLEPENSSSNVNYILWLETDQQLIKSVNSIIDTVQLATLSNLSVQSISDNLPTADPLVISDYDQQDHLQNELAWPSNLITGNDKKIKILDQWWSIWIQRQLANIDKVYAENALVSLPGQAEQSNRQGIFDFVLSVTSKLTRVFTQIEDIVIEDTHVAIKWFLDGDESSGKVRLPFFTVLEIDNGQIVSDTTVCDILSFNKYFNQSRIFDHISPDL
jgi:hypothetical protein